MSALEDILATDPDFSLIVKAHEKSTAKFFFNPTPEGGDGFYSAGNIKAYADFSEAALTTRTRSDGGARWTNDEQLDSRSHAHELACDERAELGEWLINLIRRTSIEEDMSALDLPLFHGSGRLEEYRQGTQEPFRVTEGNVCLEVITTPSQEGDFGEFTVRVLWAGQHTVTKRDVTVAAEELDLTDCLITFDSLPGGGNSFECYVEGVVTSDTLGSGDAFDGNWITGRNPLGVQGSDDFESLSVGSVTSDTVAPTGDGFSGNWITGPGS